jgi:hypothetical protein
MKIPRVEEISREVLDLLNRQLETISGPRLSNLTRLEKRAYQKRGIRIEELEAELRTLQARR